MHTEETILQVPIEEIIPNRFQPRLSFDDNALNDLASSIKEHGIIQPLVLRRKGEKYEIIAGERRYKAARLAGLASVPAIISHLDDNESAEVAIVENVQRKDLSAIEEARSYQALLDKGYMTQEDLAKRMGLSQSAISNKLRLLTLAEEVQEAVIQEKISERHARSLLKVHDLSKQIEYLHRIIDERLTVKQLEEELKKTQEDHKEVEMVMDKDMAVSNDIKSDIDLNKAEDIAPNEINESVRKNTFFTGNPAQMPNKFFNFLEDSAANMNFTEEVEEPVTPSDFDKTDSLTETIEEPVEEIEMLDGLDIDSEKEESDDEIKKIVQMIRDLNLTSDTVSVDELDLPNEYQINIKIKKQSDNTEL